MFIVVPQFLVTGLSSIIFAIFDPQKSVLHGHHPGNAIPVDDTITTSGDVMRQILDPDEDLSAKTGPNSVAIIFRWVPMLSCMVAKWLTRVKSGWEAWPRP
jgi:solute carrier family 45 protein 1/2/4